MAVHRRRRGTQVQSPDQSDHSGNQRNHLEEGSKIKRRSAPYTPLLFGVIHVAYPKVWSQVFNPVLNHHFGTENDFPMIFSFLTPPPHIQVPLFFGVWVWGVASKLLCVLQPLCVDSDLGVE